MRVLVTGGAGYIGSHVSRALQHEGFEVRILDNLSTGHRFLADQYDFVEGDLLDSGLIRDALQDVDAVMHFAASTDVAESTKDPRKYFVNNFEAGLCLLDVALEQDVKLFIHSSTCAVYGLPSKIPITEDVPRLPVSPYGASKLAFENALEAYDRAYGLRYIELRYFNAAGADESAEIGELHFPETHLIPCALEAAANGTELQIYGTDYPTPDGTCVRDYIHVNDLADAHLRGLNYLQRGGESVALNLGSGSGHSVREIAAAVETATQRPLRRRISPRRPGDPPVLVADSSKARKVLGWQPMRTLPLTVASAWAWMNSEASITHRMTHSL